MSIAINAAINDVFKSSVRAWKKLVQAYVLDNANFLLEVMPEIEFMICATRLMEALQGPRPAALYAKAEARRGKSVFSGRAL